MPDEPAPEASSTPPDEAVDEAAEETVDVAAGIRTTRKAGTTWPFPRRSLEDAVQVADELKAKNAGNPWPPEEVAKALGTTQRSSGFHYLTSAARDYGLTVGTSRSAEIALTDLGRQVVYPETADSRIAALTTAFTSVELFRKVLEYYQGSHLPEMEYLSNVLTTQFSISLDLHENFRRIFLDNCKYLSISDYPDRGGTRRQARVGVAAQADQSLIRTASDPNVHDKPVCFVAMPFTERDDSHEAGFFREVLDNLLTPALEAAGFVVRTARRAGSDVIHSTIVNKLLDADLVVVDLTEHNPNVLFELGMRMAEDRPVALVRARGTRPIFDVDNMLRVEDYNPNLWPSTVKSDLPILQRHFEAAWDGRDTDVTFLQLLKRPKVN